MAKETVKKAVVRPTPTTTRRKKAPAATAPTYGDIATRAYYIHLEQGGDAFENWIRAEREMIAA